jgi:hypothetical protein
MRNGRLVRKDRAGPKPGQVHVISDNLPDLLEHHSYSDGRRTDSKSTFRRWTREAGDVEKGNDRNPPPRAKTQDIRHDVALALQMCKSGHKPVLRFSGSDGWHD